MATRCMLQVLLFIVGVLTLCPNINALTPGFGLDPTLPAHWKYVPRLNGTATVSKKVAFAALVPNVQSKVVCLDLEVTDRFRFSPREIHIGSRLHIAICLKRNGEPIGAPYFDVPVLEVVEPRSVAIDLLNLASNTDDDAKVEKRNGRPLVRRVRVVARLDLVRHKRLIRALTTGERLAYASFNRCTTIYLRRAGSNLSEAVNPCADHGP